MLRSNLVKTDVLKKERKSLGLTYGDMAYKMGYKSKSTYMYIEKGKTVPTLPVMLSISQILGKPIDYLFSLEFKEIDKGG